MSEGPPNNPPSYDRLIDDLRQSYDRMAEARNRRPVAAWKLAERQRFLSFLENEGKSSLLEVGAGTGVHGKFFQEKGIEVVCTDVSPKNVELCRRKGLDAHVMDFTRPAFPDSAFDALYALNCFLHVPWRDLSRGLKAVRRPLRYGGLFYLGLYGGRRQEGIWPDDHYRPKRFFSFLTDEQIQTAAMRLFSLVDFKRIHLDDEPGFHFQALILRRSPDVG